MDIQVNKSEDEVALFCPEVVLGETTWIVTVSVSTEGTPHIVSGIASFFTDVGDATFRYGRNAEAKEPVEKVFHQWQEDQKDGKDLKPHWLLG